MRKKRVTKIFAFVFAFIGIGLLLYTILPIVAFEPLWGTKITEGYLSPVPEESYSLAREVDYTKASSWFPEKEDKEFSPGKISFYTISIPKIRIDEALVSIGGEDLKDSLIQYPGTALPGQVGNAVVFGHSILPQYYDPKNYLSIFSLLPTMRKGDQIKVRYDGVTYKYVVDEIFEVLPTDIEILDQNSSGSYITLVTCTPPGHPLRPKRLIVRARLDPYNS